MTEKKNELSTIDDLETRLMDEDNLDEINKIVEMFNVNLQKKNIIRSAKLSDVQDKVVQQMTDRFENRADSFSNDDLIKYHKIIQDTLTKTDTTMDNVKTPTIQINQQVNVDNVTFNSESRKRILEAVNNILNGSEEIEEIEDIEVEEINDSE